GQSEGAGEEQDGEGDGAQVHAARIAEAEAGGQGKRAAHARIAYDKLRARPWPAPRGRVRQMKALVKTHDAPGLWLEDVPEPETGINDVLIKVDRTGICGTDVHIHNWDA